MGWWAGAPSPVVRGQFHSQYCVKSRQIWTSVVLPTVHWSAGKKNSLQVVGKSQFEHLTMPKFEKPTSAAKQPENAPTPHSRPPALSLHRTGISLHGVLTAGMSVLLISLHSISRLLIRGICHVNPRPHRSVCKCVSVELCKLVRT